MKRRNFLAGLLALPFASKAVQVVKVDPCPYCGEAGGKPVVFYPWNDKSLTPTKACTLCQNSLDLEPLPKYGRRYMIVETHPTVIEMEAGEDIPLNGGRGQALRSGQAK